MSQYVTIPNSIMLGPSCRNVCTFCMTRPPQVVFLVSLICLAFTTLCLAWYARNTTNTLHNMDVLDWNRLLLEMSHLKYCLTDSPPSSPLSGGSRAQRTVRLQSNLLAFLSGNSSSFRGAGLIPLDHMGLGHSGQHVSVTLVQERPGPEVCVRVEGKEEVVRHLVLEEKNVCSVGEQEEVKEFQVHSKTHLPHTWCSTVSSTKFEFSYQGREDWATKLTQEDRTVMVRHLVGVSVVLFCGAFIILLYAAVKGGQSSRRVQNKSSSDGRGDMQLLATDQEDQESS